jgi:hypothetical protein
VSLLRIDGRSGVQSWSLRSVEAARRARRHPPGGGHRPGAAPPPTRRPPPAPPGPTRPPGAMDARARDGPKERVAGDGRSATAAAGMATSWRTGGSTSNHGSTHDRLQGRPPAPRPDLHGGGVRHRPRGQDRWAARVLLRRHPPLCPPECAQPGEGLAAAVHEPSTGSGGTCYGDSGGPHFLGGVESNLIVSITVTGDAMCRATDKTYRLDTPSGQGLPRRLRRPPLSRPDLSQNPADRHPFSLGLFRPRNESCITWNQHPGHQRRRRKGEQRHAGSESMPVQTKAAQDIARPC